MARNNMMMGGLVGLVILIVALVVLYQLFMKPMTPVGYLDRAVQAPVQLVDRTVVNPIQRLFAGGESQYGVQGVMDPMPRSEMYRNFY